MSSVGKGRKGKLCWSPLGHIRIDPGLEHFFPRREGAHTAPVDPIASHGRTCSYFRPSVCSFVPLKWVGQWPSGMPADVCILDPTVCRDSGQVRSFPLQQEVGCVRPHCPSKLWSRSTGHGCRARGWCLCIWSSPTSPASQPCTT